MTKVKKGVIVAAGLGTRFLPFSKVVPKELLPLISKPVLQKIVEEFAKSGISEIVIVTSPEKDDIKKHFESAPKLLQTLKERGKEKEYQEIAQISNLAKLEYVTQEEPLGNGHALLQAREKVGREPFLFAYGDDVINGHTPAAKQLVETFEKHQATVMGVTETEKENLSRYGVIAKKDIDENTFQVLKVVEKPKVEEAPSNLISCGRYLFQNDIFPALENLKPGQGGEIWLAEAVDGLIEKGKVVASKLSGEYFDCGNQLEYWKANVKLLLKNPELGEKFREFLKKSIGG